MDATYEWSQAQTWKFYHCVCHELKNGLPGKLFLFLPCITKKKVETHEEISITINFFDVTSKSITFVHCNQTVIFELFLLGWIR